MIISWNTTNKCNMHCKHCYRNSGIKAEKELNTLEGKKLIDEVKKAGFRIMIFSGGEPLIREDIYELIKYASNSGLRPVIGSNGTLITEEIAKKLKDSGAMGIGISLDSLNSQKHDEFRGFKSAWVEAVKGMKNCKAVGLPFQIHSTVMKWNKDEILNITNFGIGLGAVAHHIFFLVPTGRGENIEDQSLTPFQYEKLLKDIMIKQKQVDIELKPTCAPQFMRIANELNMRSRFRRGCLAGVSYCIVSPVGDVQPCAYLDMPIGNVRESPFSELWRESPVFKELRTLEYEGKCGECKYKKSCGGCRARAAFYNDGDYMSSDEVCIYSANEKVKVING